MNYKTLEVRNPEFLYHLANSLLMNGLSMEIAGSSRPASGSEHLISHAYDEIAKKPSMHGIQVGIATYLCSALQNNQNNKFETVKGFLRATGFFEYVAKNPLDKTDFIEAIKLATTMKENFNTVLSLPEKIDEAVSFVNTDEIMQVLVQ